MSIPLDLCRWLRPGWETLGLRVASTLLGLASLPCVFSGGVWGYGTVPSGSGLGSHTDPGRGRSSCFQQDGVESKDRLTLRAGS